MQFFKLTGANPSSSLLIWAAAIASMWLAGAIYREQASVLERFVQKPVALENPLKTFLFNVSGWTGRDIELADTIQQTAGNDDFLNRLYVNKASDKWVNLYIAYSARPRTMLGHRPKACYVAAGWVHDSTEQSQFTDLYGRKIPCLIHRFHKPAPDSRQIIVLNFYILNGRFTNSEKGFSGLGWRTPNIKGSPARYVMQVQISSALENCIREAAEDLTPLVLDCLPDKQGSVKTNFKNALPVPGS